MFVLISAFAMLSRVASSQPLTTHRVEPITTAARIDRLRLLADAGRDDHALNDILALANSGDVNAQRAAGEVLTRRADRALARDGLRWLESAAMRGDIDATLELGRVLLFGRAALQAEPTRAKDWFERAHRADNEIAAYYLGVILVDSVNGSADIELALKHFEFAANRGVADAMYRLGNALATHHEVGNDPQTAMRWYLRAAAQDHPLAIQEIAQAYARGDTLLPQSDFQAAMMRTAMSHAIRHPKAAP